ncbi:predicted protein [Nematostella vectensis]|uniref:G-protein coupled receptors family 1 profile domain-containing protein n=1 Tax=Nematostella vectensis TaxID=45351 RepID=A7SAW6_NEMVE|nr:predicted protein [Nematostella vectensis]|eukprot:XP_001631215.1 predicted protein [Nematostella vectensis]
MTETVVIAIELRLPFSKLEKTQRKDHHHGDAHINRSVDFCNRILGTSDTYFTSQRCIAETHIRGIEAQASPPASKALSREPRVRKPDSELCEPATMPLRPDQKRVLCILHINMLMTERLFAVGWPIHHRIAPEMPDYVISVGIWLAAVLISTASYLVYNHTDFQHLSFVILISCIAVPTLVAMLLFACILASSNRRNRTMALNNDFSLSVLIAIMLGAFTVTCLPLHCVNYLSYFCKDCGLTEPYYVIMMSLRSLQYSCGVFTPAVALFGVTELRRNMSWCCFTCCAVDEDSNNDLYHMEVPGMLRAAPGSQCMLTRVTPAVSTENIQLSFHEQKVETK